MCHTLIRRSLYLNDDKGGGKHLEEPRDIYTAPYMSDKLWVLWSILKSFGELW